MSVSAFGVDHGRIYKSQSAVGKAESPAARSKAREQHYGRQAASLGTVGGLSAGLATGARIVGHQEAKGKDPMGFLSGHRYGQARRAKELGEFAGAHKWQSRALGGLGAASLATAGAYKAKQVHERKQRAKGIAKREAIFTPEGKRKIQDTALGGAGVASGGTALHFGGKYSNILRGDAKRGYKEFKEGHQFLRAAKKGMRTEGGKAPTPNQLKLARNLRSSGARVAGVKGAGAVAALGASAAGGATIYEAGRHALRRKKG